MNKLVMLVISLLLLGCSNNKMMASCDIRENEVSSIVILGRAPDLIFSVSLGRCDFIDFCTRNRKVSRSIVTDNIDSINSIIQSINKLEIEQALSSSCNFYYEIVSKEGQVYFINNDPLDVMMLVVLRLKTGEYIPMWIDRFSVDIGQQRFHTSNELMTKLYNLLGYEY